MCVYTLIWNNVLPNDKGAFFPEKITLFPYPVSYLLETESYLLADKELTQKYV